MKKVLLLFGILTVNLHSQTFQLDETFGENGLTIFENMSSVSFLDFDTQGNIIAVGKIGNYITILKANADGIIDEGFGNNGLVKITDYNCNVVLGLKIKDDNKIIVIGNFGATMLMQFNKDGTVDENYGNSGIMNLNLNPSFIISVNLESNDFILIPKGESQPHPLEPQTATFIYYIVKYNYAGEIDESFGENGKVYLTDFETYNIWPNSVKILSDGSIFIAGFDDINPYDKELAFCKLNPNGGFVAEFADNGVWKMNFIGDLGLDHEYFSNVLEDRERNLILSGKGFIRTRLFISKFSSKGMLDFSFGDNGFYGFDFRGNFNPILQIGDKYLISGYYGGNNPYKITIVDNDGCFANEVYTSQINSINVIKIQETNKIILGGNYRIDNTSNLGLERIIFDLGSTINPNVYRSNNLIVSNEYIYFNDDTAFEIIDLLGKILIKSTIPVKSINIGNLSTGIYFVRFGDYVHKFVK